MGLNHVIASTVSSNPSPQPSSVQISAIRIDKEEYTISYGMVTATNSCTVCTVGGGGQ